jgi:hypothetical protein
MILQKAERGQREQLQAVMGCTKLGIPWRSSVHVGQRAECHVGTVEWCQEALGFAPRPNFYPAWADDWLRRRVLVRDYLCCPRFDVPMFIKPADSYKLAPPRILQPGELLPLNWIASEVVKFTNEWRYYVADGELLAAGWYDGSDEDEPAPVLDIAWPRGWCGAADFGRLDTGEIAVVECHHPYACGNYLEADECEAWVMWLELGWAWTLKNRC